MTEPTPIPAAPLADSQGRTLPSDLPNPQFDPAIIPTDKPVGMISPDGKGFTVPGTSVAEALTKGWTIPPEEQTYWTHQANLAKDVEAKNAPGNQEGDLVNTMADHFLSNLTGGVSDIVYNKLDDRSPEVKEIVAARKAATEKENPIATHGAGVAGFAGSLLVGGEASKLANVAEKAVAPTLEKVVGSVIANKTAASVVADLGKAVVNKTAMLESYNAPAQVTNLAAGDPDQTAQSLGWTLGLGPVLGLGGFALGKAGNLASRFNSNSEANRAIKLLNSLSDADYQRMYPDTSRKEVIDWINKYGASNVLADATKNLQTHKDNLDSRFEELKIPQPQSATVQDAASKFKTAVPGDSFVNPTTVGNTFSQEVLDKYPGMHEMPQYQEVMDAFQKAGGGPIRHAEADALRNSLSSLPDSELKDLALKHLDLSQAGALDQGMSGIGGKDLTEYLSNKSRLKYGKILESLNDMKSESTLGDFAKSVMPNEEDVTRAGIAAATGHLHVAAGILGKNVLKNIITKGVIPLGMRGLAQFADESPEFGSLLARRVNEAVDSHLETIPDILKEGGKAIPFRTIDPLSSMLGKQTTGLSKDQQYKKVTTAIANAQANPDDFSENLGALLSVFQSNPHLQSLIAQHNQTALDYLYSILPKNPNPPQAFSKNEWQPTEQQKSDFLNQVAIVDDPSLIIHKIANGSVTSKDMISLRTVYPDLADKMIGKVTQFAFSSAGVNVSGKTKHGAIMSGAVPPSTAYVNMARTQSGWSQPNPQNNPSGSPPSPKHTNTSLKGGPSMQTESQRLQYKGTSS